MQIILSSAAQQGKQLKVLQNCFPHLNREATAALIVESVNPIDSCTLVVAAQRKEVLRVLDFWQEFWPQATTLRST
jgi:hypothetical protein